MEYGSPEITMSRSLEIVALLRQLKLVHLQLYMSFLIVFLLTQRYVNHKKDANIIKVERTEAMLFLIATS